MIEEPRARRLRRPEARGKFLYVGTEKLWVRGVTYGTFRPDAGGNEYGSRDRVERDFAAIGANGFNAVRTYTVPPRWLLDAAATHGLRVMVGLPWEQHVAFLDEPARAELDRARACAPACARAPGIRPSSLRGRQRDPGPDRPLARPAARRAVPRAALRRGQGRGSGRARDLRQLPDDRVPRAAVPRPRRASTSTSSRRSASRRTSRACRTSPATGRWSWPSSASTAAATARPRRRASLDWQVRDGVRAAAAPARSSSPGPTSGTAAATTSTTGTSA